MIDALTGLGYAIVGFAVVIGIGLVILGSMASTTASCGTGFVYQTNGSTTYTTGKCCLTGGVDCSSAGNYTSPSQGSQSFYNINTYLGTSSGGLASWIPVVIVLVIGMLFLGAFMIKSNRKA